MLIVSSYSEIGAGGVYHRGQLLFRRPEQDSFETFAKSVYRQLDISYAKFFKMDALSKLAFLAAEVLLKEHSLSQHAAGADIGLIVENRHSSLSTDLEHYKTYQNRNNYFPSPAVFVYTLPNIMLGELCIRHQICGESSCFLMQEPDGLFLWQYVQQLIEQEGYAQCITGWVDYTPESWLAKLFLIEKQKPNQTGFLKFDSNFLSQLPQ